MNNPHYTEKAIPLIAVDLKTNKYVLTNQASAFIKSIPGPIGVVSVAGLYRTGKSYLLNRMLLNRSNGFGVGPTVNPCTKGLWCWGTPIKGQSSQGESVNIIVIDTQGIGALDEDQTHDTRIFTLAILASSCFIYNSVGSIDQNAVQNLSLVVNLTKHIQVRTGNKQDQQQDPDQISHYFPSFYWVVRDFSLQLVDSQGNQLSSKQYLQKALAPQKGFSDDVEEKNRIRRLLTAFFKQRECFTLIRPLVDQSKLQHLDKLDFDQLRPDFVDQILNFRKRVINKVKVKTLNQKKLNGQMYFSMLSSYVAAINDGAVPNIQNAWNYMCRQQCSKVLLESYESFDKEFKQRLSNKFPCSDQEFESACEAALEVGQQTFKKKSFGESSQQYWKQLKKKMRNRILTLKSQNQKDSVPALHQFFVKSFTPTQKKLKLGQFKSYSEFQKQMENLYKNSLENGPKLVNSKIIFLQFMRKLLPQGAQFFFKNLKNQYQKLKNISQQKQKHYQLQINQIKQQSGKNHKNFTDKITILDREKVQMQINIQNLKFELEKVTRQKLLQQQTLGKNLSSKQNELQKIKKLLQQKVQQLTKKCQQTTKKLLTDQKQWEKQKAIFQLKIKQQIGTIQQLQKKQKTLDSTLNISKNQMSLQLRQVASKYQKKMSQLNIQLNQINQQNIQLSQQLKSLKQQFENQTQKYQKKQKKYKQELLTKTKQNQKLKQQYQLQKNKISNQYQISKQGIQKQYRELVDNTKKQQLIIKNLNQVLKQQKTSFQTQNAILSQKIEFLQENLRDAKQQLIQVKQSYQATISTLEAANGQINQEIQNQRILDLKHSHSRELKNLQTQFESIKKKMDFDIQNLTKTKNDLQLRLSLLSSNLENEKGQSQTNLTKMQQTIANLSNELKTLERSKTTILMQKQAYYQNKLKQMEQQVQQIKQRSISQQRDSHSKSQQAITQLKIYYQFQKQKLQSKLIAEKERNQKKYSELIQQYQRRQRQQIEGLQDQLQQNRQQLMTTQATLQGTINQLQHDIDLKLKQIQNLQKSLHELKQNYNKKQIQMSKKYDNLVQTSRTQKQIQYQKIQALQIQNNKKDKQTLSLNHLKDQLINNLQKKQSQLSQLQVQVNDMKQNYQKNIQQLKKKIQLIISLIS